MLQSSLAEGVTVDERHTAMPEELGLVARRQAVGEVSVTVDMSFDEHKAPERVRWTAVGTELLEA